LFVIIAIVFSIFLSYFQIEIRPRTSMAQPKILKQQELNVDEPPLFQTLRAPRFMAQILEEKEEKDVMQQLDINSTIEELLVLELNVSVLEEQAMMHAYRAGSGEVTFLLIHGDADDQDALHWLPHFSMFAELGAFYALDMIGHGWSTSEPLEVDVNYHNKALSDFVDKILPDMEKPQLVLVGRSWGGGRVLDLVPKFRNYIKGIILISPSVGSLTLDRIPQDMKEQRILLVGSRDDVIIPFERTRELLSSAFSALSTLVFDYVLVNGMDERRSHAPENLRIDEFQKAVRDYVEKL